MRRRYSSQGIFSSITTLVVIAILVIFWKKIANFLKTIGEGLKSIVNFGGDVGEKLVDAGTFVVQETNNLLTAAVNPVKFTMDNEYKKVYNFMSTQSFFSPDYWVKNSTEQEKEKFHKMTAPLEIYYNEAMKFYLKGQYFKFFIAMRDILNKCKTKNQVSYYCYVFFKKFKILPGSFFMLMMAKDVGLTETEFRAMLKSMASWATKFQ